MNKKKSLLVKFVEFNNNKRMASAKKHTLLAVSGGMDSVAMCHLFHEAKFPFAVAHCNFGLRGKESDEDEQFVKDLGSKYGAEVFVKKFATQKYADEQGISVQLAARKLRYAWFEEVRKQKQLQLIATAHHLNDNIETIIFNFTKGTGIRGLRGIPLRQGNVIRPLLFASREEIENYCSENKLSYREDSSNAEDKYTRNKIRHHVIPLLKEINPSLENTFAEKVELFTELEALYEKQVSKSSVQLFLKRGNDIYIPLLKLKKIKNPSSTLFEFLKEYDFNAEQVEDMLAALDAEPGKQFLSSKARVIKDRQFFILTKLSEVSSAVQFLYNGNAEVELNDRLLLKVSNLAHPLSANELKTKDKKVAYIDKAKLAFPLIVRKWKQGDYFYPFGMKLKKKKLKKFFTDEKVPLHEKENILVVESNKKIIWVLGYRIDERFKVTDKTTEIFKFQLGRT